MASGLFSRTTEVSQYQKGRTILDFNEVRDDGVQRKLDFWRLWHLTNTAWSTDGKANKTHVAILVKKCLTQSLHHEASHILCRKNILYIFWYNNHHMQTTASQDMQ